MMALCCTKPPLLCPVLPPPSFLTLPLLPPLSLPLPSPFPPPSLLLPTPSTGLLSFPLTSPSLQAALDIWVMILRFMGDMPEPKVMQSPQEKENTSFAKKLYGSISKKFSGSKLAEELGEVRLGEVGGIEGVG